MIKNEKQVEDKIIDICHKFNCKTYRIEGKLPSDDGIPDLLVVRPNGSTFFLEAKYKTKLRAAQKMFLATVKESYYVKFIPSTQQIEVQKGKETFILEQLLLGMEG